MIMMVVMMMMMAAGRKKSRFWLVSFPRLCPEPVSTNDLFLSFLVLSFLLRVESVNRWKSVISRTWEWMPARAEIVGARIPLIDIVGRSEPAKDKTVARSFYSGNFLLAGLSRACLGK
jgi:hypothetical protein